MKITVLLLFIVSFIGFSETKPSSPNGESSCLLGLMEACGKPQQFPPTRFGITEETKASLNEHRAQIKEWFSCVKKTKLDGCEKTHENLDSEALRVDIFDFIHGHFDCFKGMLYKETITACQKATCEEDFQCFTTKTIDRCSSFDSKIEKDLPGFENTFVAFCSSRRERNGRARAHQEQIRNQKIEKP